MPRAVTQRHKVEATYKQPTPETRCRPTRPSSSVKQRGLRADINGYEQHVPGLPRARGPITHAAKQDKGSTQAEEANAPRSPQRTNPDAMTLGDWQRFRGYDPKTRAYVTQRRQAGHSGVGGMGEMRQEPMPEYPCPACGRGVLRFQELPIPMVPWPSASRGTPGSPSRSVGLGSGGTPMRRGTGACGPFQRRSQTPRSPVTSEGGTGGDTTGSPAFCRARRWTRKVRGG